LLLLSSPGRADVFAPFSFSTIFHLPMKNKAGFQNPFSSGLGRVCLFSFTNVSIVLTIYLNHVKISLLLFEKGGRIAAWVVAVGVVVRCEPVDLLF
jgi:hypothetical protein